MSSNKQLYLFRDRRFLPLFLVQFFGALNDSTIKNALVILITYKLANEMTWSVNSLAALANAALMVPFVLFASIAGQLADRYERSTIVKIIKFTEIWIILLAIYGFFYTNITVLFACVVLTGVHSAFFGPIKYSFLPDVLKKQELLGANGFFESGTFLAILFGTILGNMYNFSHLAVIILAFAAAIIGFVASLYLPKANNANRDVKVSYNVPSETWKMLKYSTNKKQVYLAILGISWFWYIGATMLAQVPLLAKDILGFDEWVSMLFLVTFSVGVGFGSFWCNKILANEITTKYVFISAIGISAFGIDLFFATRIAEISYEPEQLRNIFQFLSRLHYWRIIIDLFFLSAISGLYVVPLFAVMQYFSAPAYRSRVVAANNLMNSIFMASSAFSLNLFFAMGFSIPSIILINSLLNLVIAFHIYRFVPGSVIMPIRIWAAIIKLIVLAMYRVEVIGAENIKKTGLKTVVIANHLSFLDPTLISLYISNHLRFAINIEIAQKWWVKPFLRLVKTFPLDPLNPMAVKSLIGQVKKNNKIAIFPEGRISTTGSLMKVYEGSGMVAEKANATILPVAIRGTEFTIFSKMKHIRRGFLGFRQKITIHIMPPVKLAAPEGLGNKERRRYFSMAVYDLMRQSMYAASHPSSTIYESLLHGASNYGYDSDIFEDIDGNSETYRSAIMKSYIMADFINNKYRPNEQKKQDSDSVGQVVGLMMPTMVGGAISFYGAQLTGLVPAMINYTSGPKTILNCCKVAGVRQIFTSKRFVRSGKLENIISALDDEGVEVVYFEELKKSITTSVKLKALIFSMMPGFLYSRIKQNLSITADAAGVVLFTSGTEGMPKAVVLSHKNIMANKAQALSHLDFGQQDSALNTLPLFHCFGLTAKIIMASYGVRTFFYPSPLHYKVIPEIIYNYAMTIMFSTDTFLNGYAAYATHYDLYTMKYVIAGAEKLKETTRKLWLNKFGIRILEGYGVTECSPVVSANSFMYYKEGTVGRFMPNIEYRIKKIDGIDDGGVLCVKGPNVMLGYIDPQNNSNYLPTQVEKLGLGWYDTGDIVKVDDQGYVTIIGRKKRFAKIGGEMVSLTLVESIAAEIMPESMHAAAAIEDKTKGEQIILISDTEDISREKFTEFVARQKYSELLVPRRFLYTKKLPLLGTGKLDYKGIAELIEQKNKKSLQ